MVVAKPLNLPLEIACAGDKPKKIASGVIINPAPAPAIPLNTDITSAASPKITNCHHCIPAYSIPAVRVWRGW
jgi:hypothetical protein